jgi:hypothetical protein
MIGAESRSKLEYNDSTSDLTRHIYTTYSTSIVDAGRVMCVCVANMSNLFTVDI